MTEVPKIVYDRLHTPLSERSLSRPEESERAHPDADLLTGFIERALSATERDNVLEHLSLCFNCREVVALALPPANDESVASPVAIESETAQFEHKSAMPGSAKAKRSWLTSAKFGWPQLAAPSLRWAALAAGITVAATVLLMHPGKLNQAMLQSPSRQADAVGRQDSAPQIASSSGPSAQVTLVPSVPLPNQGTRPTSELPSAKRLKLGQLATPSRQAAASFAVNTTIPATSTPSAEGTLIARNDAPPIEKAKPPLPGSEEPSSDAQGSEAKGTEASNLSRIPVPTRPASPGSRAPAEISAAKLEPSTSATPAQLTFAQHLAQKNVTWQVSGGVLQKSLDNGQSWNSVLHANQPLLCLATHDNDIWTGGRAGALFHSSDNGVTWVQVQPAINTQQLNSDITHLDLQSYSEIVVSTASNETWHSTDSGKTWQKR
jgi:hypothetical protein